MLSRLGAQLRGWAGLQEAEGCRLELSMHLSGLGGNGDMMEAGLDRLLPALIEALSPVAASVHTLTLSYTTHQVGGTMSASLVRTLPSLRELHIKSCRLHDSLAAPLAQLRQLRLLRLEEPRHSDETDWGQLAAALAALLADGGQVMEGGGGEGRLRLEWREDMCPNVAKVKRLQVVVEAVSAAGLATLFTHDLELLRGAVVLHTRPGAAAGCTF